jgi:CRP-like cAMP-binding protein
MIPHGPKFSFEMQEPFDKITLPMILADFVMLCSGQFTIREIAEKIYRKQGAVPFRLLLETLYTLESRGFLENTEKLSQQPWLLRQQLFQRKFYYDFRFKFRIIRPSARPATFYLLSLIIFIGSAAGLVLSWDTPFTDVASSGQLTLAFGLKLFATQSLILSIKHSVRTLQILTLNGRTGNFSIRFSIWGIYFRATDGVSGFGHNRLFLSLFHASQILLPFGMVALASTLFPKSLFWLFPLAFAQAFWECNPFRKTELFNLLRATIDSKNLDATGFNNSFKLRNDLFLFSLAAVGILWILVCVDLLASLGARFGGATASAFSDGDFSSRIGSATTIVLWLGTLFFAVHSLVETTAALLKEKSKIWKERLNQKARRRAHSRSDKWMVQSLHALPLFTHLTTSGLQRLVAASKLEWYEAGYNIVNLGDNSTDIYILFEGAVVMELGQTRTPILPTTIFGEGALLEAGIRTASVKATEHSLCLKIPISIVRQIARESHVIGELEHFMTAIMVDQFFASAPLFRSLPREGIEFLSARGVLEFVSTNETIFNQGDVGEYFYMVVRGSVHAVINNQKEKTISQGGFFGEISLIANISRTATIVASEPSVLFKISADAFWEVLVQHMEMAVFIEGVGEKRLQEELDLMKIPG